MPADAPLTGPGRARRTGSSAGDTFRPMSPIRRALTALLMSALVAGCGVVSTTPPIPSPADFSDIANGLASRGIRIDHVVSGDAGCSDPDLIPTAIGLDAAGLDQATIVRLHLYIFRNRDSFEKLRETVDICARSFVTDPETFESIDESPYVLAGQGPWGQQFEQALRDGLKVSAGDGGNSGGYGGY
jgi:hypothetical protein